MTQNLLTNYHFQVDWGGSRLGFEEVQNLTAGVQVIEYRDGNSPVYSTQKFPGRPYYENIILMRGVAKGDDDLYQWWKTVLSPKASRRDIVISLLDEEHKPVLRWAINNAFPVKITWADLKATGNQILIESLEIAHEGITAEYI